MIFSTNILRVSITFCLIFFLYNCNNGSTNVQQKGNSEKFVKCLHTYKKTIDTSAIYHKVLHDAHDSISNWINLGLSTTISMREAKWDIDSVIFFNKNFDKCLFLVPEVFGNNEPTDNCLILGGELIYNKWHFYYESYPTNDFFRKNKDLPHTREYLVFETQKSLIKDGLFTTDCKINSDYINSDIWFADWRRMMHQKFLSGGHNIE